MKILISTDTYYPHVNGASYFTQRLAFYLQQQNHEVLVVAPATTYSFEEKNFNGVPMFGVPSFPILSFGFRIVPPFAIKKNIEKAVVAFDPDIIHVQGHFTVSKNVIAAAKKNGLRAPVVGTNHFMPENLVHYFHLPGYFEKKLMQFAWKDFRKTFDTLYGVTSPTRTAANLATSTGFAKQIEAISCGIDLARFNPSQKNKAIRAKYALPDVPLLLFVGRLDKEKDVDVVLQAVAKISRDIPFHFAIAGKGQEANRLKKLAEKLKITDRVTFLGFVPDEDLAAIYAESDCFVNACTAELQCIGAMEAMASGLPVIGANAVALPELVHDNENGFLFEPKNSDELAAKIERMFTDAQLRETMGLESLSIIAEHDINATIASFEKMYASAILKKNHETDTQ